LSFGGGICIFTATHTYPQTRKKQSEFPLIFNHQSAKRNPTYRLPKSKTMSGLEVIGVAASIAGIIDVASKVIGGVADYANAVKNHEGSIKALQTELRSMNDTLSHIQKLIDEADDRSDQSLRRILQGSGADPGEIEECHRTLEELEKLLQKYEVADKKPGKFEFSRHKAKSRKWSSPITDEDIGEFTSRLRVHCGKLSLNIGVDTK